MDTPPTPAELLDWPVTVPVPRGGSCFGLGREASYAAAARGELPGALKIGRRWIVVTSELRRALGIENGHRDDGGDAT